MNPDQITELAYIERLKYKGLQKFRVTTPTGDKQVSADAYTIHASGVLSFFFRDRRIRTFGVGGWWEIKKLARESNVGPWK